MIILGGSRGELSLQVVKILSFQDLTLQTMAADTNAMLKIQQSLPPVCV